MGFSAIKPGCIFILVRPVQFLHTDTFMPAYNLAFIYRFEFTIFMFVFSNQNASCTGGAIVPPRSLAVLF